MSIQPVQRYNIYPKDVSKELYQKEENVKLPYMYKCYTYHTYIQNIGSFEGRDRHYHWYGSESDRTSCDNACLFQIF